MSFGSRLSKGLGQVSASPEFFEKLVTKRRLAEELALSESCISKLMASEGLPYFKIGRAVRYRISEVVRWLHERS